MNTQLVSFLFKNEGAQSPTNRYDKLMVWVFFSIPFVFSGAEISLGFVALFGIYLWIKERHQFWRTLSWRSLDTWIYLALASVFILKLSSTLWASVPYVAFKSSMSNIHFVLWPLVLGVFYKASQPMAAMTRGMALGAMATAICGVIWIIIRLNNGGNVSQPPFEAGAQNAGVLAHIACVYALWLLAAACFFSSGLKKSFLMVGFFAAFTVLLCSTRRIQLVIFFMIAIPMVGFYIQKHLSAARLIQVLSTSLILIATAIWLMVPKFEQAYQEADAYLSQTTPQGTILQTSIGNRLEYYHIATSAVKDQPILGYGAGIKPIKLSQYSHDPQNMAQYGHFHNQYLQTLVEIGVLGSLVAAAALLFLWSQMVFKTRPAHPNVATGFTLLFLVYMLTGLFSIAVGQGVINSALVLISAALWAQYKHQLTQRT